VTYKLVTFKKDYADEFDVFGITIMTTNQLSNFLAEAKEYKGYPVEMCFGTNECLDFQSFDDLFDSLEFSSMSAEMVDTLEALFDGNTFGWFPHDITEY